MDTDIKLSVASRLIYTRKTTTEHAGVNTVDRHSIATLPSAALNAAHDTLLSATLSAVLYTSLGAVVKIPSHMSRFRDYTKESNKDGATGSNPPFSS